MKTKRLPLLPIGLLAFGVCVSLGAVILLPPKFVTQADFDRIKVGMARAEVVEILGEGSPHVFAMLGYDIIFNDALHWDASDGSRATVAFVDDRVELTLWLPSTQTLWDKLRRWLRLK